MLSNMFDRNKKENKRLEVSLGLLVGYNDSLPKSLKKTFEDAWIFHGNTTKYYQYSDHWHYDSAGYIDLGEHFAKALHKLMVGKKQN